MCLFNSLTIISAKTIFFLKPHVCLGSRGLMNAMRYYLYCSKKKKKNSLGGGGEHHQSFAPLIYFSCFSRGIGNSSMGNLDCFPRGKLAATESRYTTYDACRVFYCFHSPPYSDMDYRIFIVHTDVNTCDCTQVVYGHTVRESALKGNSF